MLQGFFRRVAVHSIAAKARWRFVMEDARASKALWNQVLAEEVGKLNRACNKLRITSGKPDVYENVRAKWLKEARHRLVSIASVCARFYEVFPESPD